MRSTNGLLFAAFLALAACSGGTKTSETAVDTPSPSPAAAESASGAPSAAPAPSASLAAVSFGDIKGVFGEKEITQLAQLGVFGDASGHFQPSKPVLRRDFVRWLFKANNAIWADDATKLVHPAEGTTSSFPDVASSDPDFKYIQGMQDAGISVGFPDKRFRPAAPLTHEQAIAIKEALDRGGVDSSYKDTHYALYNVPSWKDKEQISPQFLPAIATDYEEDRGSTASWQINNVTRAFGAIAMFHPKQPVTRSQAAILLWKIGPHGRISSDNLPRTAEQALAPKPGPSATP